MDTIGGIMTPLEIMHEVFDKYKYEYDRPNYLPNNRQICDNPLLVQFLVQYFFEVLGIFTISLMEYLKKSMKARHKKCHKIS